MEQLEPKENQSPETEQETTTEASEPEEVLLGGGAIPGEEEPCPCPCPCDEE
jgi:hypothetical protein